MAANAKGKRPPSNRRLPLIIGVLGILILVVFWLIPRQLPRVTDSVEDSNLGVSARTVPFVPAAPGDKIRIRVLSNKDGAPIPGAQIDFVSSQKFDPSSTDTDGWVVLEQVNKVGRLTIRANGFVGLAGRVTLVPGDYTLLLTPTGGVELKFTDYQDQPVPDVGVQILLLHPVNPTSDPQTALDGELHETPSHHWESILTDDDGSVRWNQLPPGEGYSWRVVSSHLVKKDNAEFPPGVKATPTGFISGVSEGDHSPGHFEITSGEITSIARRILRQTSVEGVLPLEPGGTGRITLFHISEYRHPTKDWVSRSFDQEGTAIPSADGKFRFAPVRPGKKCLRTYWSGSGGHIFFAFRNFEVLEGERKDLGVLSVAEGQPLVGSVRLEGEESLPQSVKISSLKVRLHVRNRPPPPFDGSVGTLEKVEVGLGPIVLHGIIEGNLWIRAEMSSPIPGVEVEYMLDKKYPIPGTDTVDLVIRIKAVAKVQVTAHYPEGNPSGALKVFFAPQNEDYRARVAEMPNNSGTMTGSFSVAAGEYEVWVYSASNEDDSGNYFGKATGTFTSSGQNQIDVYLAPGATIKGMYVKAPTRDEEQPPDGKQHSVFLGYKVEPFTDIRDHYPYTFTVEKNGSFTLTGVNPGCILVPLIPTGRIQAGGAGSEVHVRVLAPD